MNNDRHLKELIARIKGGDVVLFLGAGASIRSQAPSGAELIQKIKKKFPDAESESNNFLDVCQEVADTPGYGRPTLEKFIRNEFYGLKPGESTHKKLPLHQWPAIFTTNYDDLVEKAYEDVYRGSGEKTPRCIPILREQASYALNKWDELKLFKLLGCTTEESEEGRMVLTRSDYNRDSKRRRRMLETLSDFVKAGTILYIGYSFRDRLVFEVIDEAYDLVGKDNISYSYALVPGFEPDTKLDHMLKERRIIPLPYTFESFMEKLLEEEPTVSVEGKMAKTLNLKGMKIEIRYKDFEEYEEYFEILCEEALEKGSKKNPNPGDKEEIREFFRGKIDGWRPFIEKWDFERDIYKKKGGLKERVKEELEKTDPKDNNAILIQGPSGLGKSILLKRLAYDFYKSGTPIIILFPYRTAFDYKLIDKFCEEIREKLNKDGKVLILLDDASTNVRHVKRIASYLSSRSKPALLVAASRANEWATVEEKTSLDKILEKNIYEMQEDVLKEIPDLIEHLISIGVLPKETITDRGYWEDKVVRRYQNSFFATIYGLVIDARRRLEEIIKDEYNKLASEMTKKSYQYISSFYQYGIPLKLELLVRTLGCSYSEFTNQIYQVEAKDVILEEEGPFKNLYFRARHKIIAEKLLQRILDTERSKDRLAEILSKVNPFDRVEMETVRSLLIARIGPNGSDKDRFSSEQKKELFDCIINREIDDAPILHHYGILEIANKNYDRAVALLNKALKVIDTSYVPSFVGEKKNIQNTLGRLYSGMAGEAEEKGEINKASRLHRIADQYFEAAKRDDPTSPYPYHSKAIGRVMSGDRLAKDGDQEGAFRYYAEALGIVEEAKDSVPKEHMDKIWELEVSIFYDRLGDYWRAIKVVEEMINANPRDPKGYCLKSRFLIRGGEGKERKGLTIDAQKKYNEAFDLIQKGLEKNPSDQNLLRLYSKLFEKLYPDDIKGLYEIFIKRFRIVQSADEVCSDLNLLFKLGFTSFELEKYPEAREFFSMLEDKSGGHPLRRGFVKKSVDRSSGKPKVFNGVVKQFRSHKEGYIQSREIGWIGFDPRAQKREIKLFDLYEFNVVFNYRGMLAINLRR